jgi:tetracycline resistance efflux pump
MTKGAYVLYGTAWSLLPFLIVIPISLWTRQVLPGLLAGLLVGSYMLHPSFLGGVNATLSYILKEVAIPDNLRLIVFLYGFGAFVGLVRATGGVAGFAKWIENRIRTIRGAFAVTWVSSLATFMAPDFRIITVAPVMRHVFDRLRVPPSLVAYIIDLTSTPLCAIIPIGTVFVGYMVGLIASTGRHNALAHNPFLILLSSIPFNFFSLAILGYGLIRTFFTGHVSLAAESSSVGTQSESSKEVKAERKAELKAKSRIYAYEHAEELSPNPESARGRQQAHGNETFPDVMELVSEHVQPVAIHLVVPLALLIILTLFLTWWDGHLRANSVLGALAQANAAKAMLEALLITLVASLVWYTVRRQPIGRTMWALVAGGNEMMGVIVLLVFVWGVSAVSADLGFIDYTQRTIRHLIPPSLLAPALFVFGCVISYVIGSSFGTWGMLLPLGYSIATGTGASLPLITGAVFASGTFGGFASPLSDNTVAMATVMKLPVVQYARYKAKSGLYLALLCTLLYAIAGWLLHA